MQGVPREGTLGLVGETSHAGVSKAADEELELESERVRHGDVLGGKRNRAGKTARNLLEGGPPKILRRDDACTCDGGSIPGLSVCKN